MQKIILGTTEFMVNSLISNEFAGVEMLAIEFMPTVSFSDVQAFFDTNLDANNLVRLEVFGEVITDEVVTWELQGVHSGYTKPTDISIFSGVTKVKIQRELAIETTVKQQERQIVEIENAVAEMAFGGGL